MQLTYRGIDYKISLPKIDRHRNLSKLSWNYERVQTSPLEYYTYRGISYTKTPSVVFYQQRTSERSHQ